MAKEIFNPLINFESIQDVKLKSFVTEKHPQSICIVNYKGGVGKTTVSCLLGYYLCAMGEEIKKKRDGKLKDRKVLLIDIDPQCSLSLAVGFDPETVNRSDFTIYDLVKPSQWTKIKNTNFNKYIRKVPDALAPKGLFIIPGSFNVDDLDMKIAKSIALEGEKRKDQLFLYCKQMIYSFEKYDYIIIDCPPNKMFLTQAMLRACQFYLPVTIPDRISIYGMPRLLRWVKMMPEAERPLMLGYLLNAVNRTGGPPGGKVYSQQIGERDLQDSIKRDLMAIEKKTFGINPSVGELPRLDRIAKFLSQRESKMTRYEFTQKTSGQPTIEECLNGIVCKIIERIKIYNAKN